jgi:hypothetical protein
VRDLPFAFVPVLVITVASLLCHVVTTLYLMQILNRTFDPHWVPQMLFPPVGFAQRYKWTLFYSGAVLFKGVRQTIFENMPYDFRANVNRTTVVVCVVHHLLGAAAALGLLALAGYGLWELWVWWQALPRPVEPKKQPIPDFDSPLAP